MPRSCGCWPALALAFTASASVGCVMGDEELIVPTFAAAALLLCICCCCCCCCICCCCCCCICCCCCCCCLPVCVSADAAFAAAALPSLFSCCSCCSSLACFFFEINRVDKRKFKCACYLRAANKGSKEGSNKQERAWLLAISGSRKARRAGGLSSGDLRAWRGRRRCVVRGRSGHPLVARAAWRPAAGPRRCVC